MNTPKVNHITSCYLITSYQGIHEIHMISLVILTSFTWLMYNSLFFRYDTLLIFKNCDKTYNVKFAMLTIFKYTI